MGPRDGRHDRAVERLSELLQSQGLDEVLQCGRNALTLSDFLRPMETRHRAGSVALARMPANRDYSAAHIGNGVAPQSGGR